ncbi:uncharacterized protein LOC124805595 [Schistocerca piceifrons]|uniref:uncharacterized protein LOC124805595 n=1 Tax=Schistocerca piceifrons TaxID=274613 RepID=UPI001F5F412E|nr:uncharacterized protein LOC124805595 [Schistocerca piceifrons]
MVGSYLQVIIMYQHDGFTMEGPKYVSNRSKRIVALARSQNYLEESDSEVDSDESCIPDEDLTIQDPRNETDNDDDSPNDDDRDDETIREIFEVENTAVREETGEQPQSDITSGGSRLITPQKPADVASSSTRSDDTLDESRLPVSYYGRNKCFTWSSTPVRSKTRTAASNIIKPTGIRQGTLDETYGFFSGIDKEAPAAVNLGKLERKAFATGSEADPPSSGRPKKYDNNYELTECLNASMLSAGSL